MAKTVKLPKEVDSMCAACLKKATHLIVISYSYGRLIPVCEDHTDLHDSKEGH